MEVTGISSLILISFVCFIPLSPTAISLPSNSEAILLASWEIGEQTPPVLDGEKIIRYFFMSFGNDGWLWNGADKR